MDWITAQFGCSVSHAFRVLTQRIKADVDLWRKHPEATGRLNVTHEGQLLMVSRSTPLGGEVWTSLQQSEGRLIVRMGTGTTGTTDFTLHPTLNAKAECRLLRGTEELEFWQASRLILQTVLF